VKRKALGQGDPKDKNLVAPRTQTSKDDTPGGREPQQEGVKPTKKKGFWSVKIARGGLEILRRGAPKTHKKLKPPIQGGGRKW